MATGLLTTSHILILLIIALLILGPKRLPQAGRALGRSMREFKEAITGPDAEPGPRSELPASPAGEHERV